jgi:uncharacterized protein involved in exopolysaccharide biosynthesis
MKFEEMQKLLSDNLEIIHLADIARALSVSPQVVNNWKTRDSIPYKYVKKIREIEDSKKLENEFNKEDLRLLKSLQKIDSVDNVVDDEVSIKDDLIKIILGLKTYLTNYYKFILLFTSFVVTVTAFYVIYVSPLVYKTSVTILPVESADSNNRANGLASQFGLSIGGGSSNLASTQLIPDLIKSNSLLGALLNQMISKDDSSKITLSEHFFGSQNGYDLNSPFFRQKGIELMKSKINVQKRKLNNLIDIIVSDSDAQTAVEIAMGVVEELDRIQKKINLTRAKEKLIYISERLTTVEKELKVTEETLKEFREKNRNLNGSPSLLLSQNRLIREVGSVSNIYNTLKSQYEITRIEEMGSSKLIQIVDMPTKPIYRSSPRRTRSVIISFCFGLCLSVLILYTKEIYPSIYDRLK